MQTTNYVGEIRPSLLQEWLLRATFLSGEAAIEAWLKWRSKVDLDGHVDAASFRLLPRLYHNLQSQGIEDPLLMKFKGVYRQTWYKNQRLLRSIETPVYSLLESGIDLLALYGPDFGLYPVTDFALLVHEKQAIETVRQLRLLGWIPKLELSGDSIETYISAGYGHYFHNRTGDRIRLQWQVLPEFNLAKVDDDFWAMATATKVSEIPMYILNPTDQLLYVCLQSISSQTAPLFLRAGEAMMVLNAIQAQIDWPRLNDLVQKYHLHLPVRNVLSYLQDMLADISLPPEELSRLQAIPISRREQIVYKFKNRRVDLIGELPVLWFNYSRRGRNINLLQRVIRFSKVVQQTWGVNHLWQTPFHAVLKGMQRFWRIAMVRGRKRYLMT